jgi:hypothetical protein
MAIVENPKHGSPQDRGAADAYYGRKYNPHWYPSGTYNGKVILEEAMTKEQVEEYKYGYANQEDKKDWG